MTITKLTSPFLLAAALLIAPACDSEDASPDTELRAEIDGDADVDAGDHADRKRGHHNPAERLCEAVACSDDQRSEVEALFAAEREAHEARKGEHQDKRAEHEAKRAELDKALADAFRAETFDTSALERGHSDEDKQARQAKHLERATSMIVGLHRILNPEQRAQLAAQIGERGPRFLHMGRGRHHGPKGEKHRGKRGRHEGEARREHKSPEERVAHHVERFCEPLTCTEDQKTQLAAAFEGAHEARRDMPKPDFQPLADAFTADSLDVDAVQGILAAAKPGKDHIEGFGNVIAEVHDILTPEQRSIVADKIEAEGPRGLMGKHGRRGGKHHGKRGKHHGERGE